MSEALLLRGAEAVLTGLPGAAAHAGAADIRIRDGRIAHIGPNLLAQEGERVLDASGCVVYPGWVNTHHHLFQSLLKAVPEGLDQPLMGWLAAVPFRFQDRFDPELLETAATIGLAELLLSGTTTCADHHYLYFAAGDDTLGDLLFDVAERFGMRFVLCRGGATDTEQFTDYPNRIRPQTVERYAADVERLTARFHQRGPDAMRQVVMAPSTPLFSATAQGLRELAAHARRLGIRMHSHLSETADYVRHARETHGMKPVEYCAEHDWLGPDVWYAHLVHVDEAEIALLTETGTGIAHCPASNCRLGSGVAPVPKMAAAGMPVSLGVDGAASSEAADMISEARLAWLVHRAVGGAQATTVEDVVHWGTRGGARLLGLDAVGTLEVGMAADLAVYELSHPRYFGQFQPALAPVLGGGAPVMRYVLVGGRVVVENGVIPWLDMEALRVRAAEGVARLMRELA
ncbi:amidohydrolase family protein [Acidihalobacter ferrooxydans]|uniref:Amidohydrolase n=1 Tax=Acidihalobacter ferrooxydans TaxID=1765967 RepID=A0A1P8UGL3_9GAMM|nr:amidohydrolase family protein [Acidihalobacter ferrooxydans]APZ42965.1 amidohydrolase [Acidihalobacter ferrooxydans]